MKSFHSVSILYWKWSMFPCWNYLVFSNKNFK